MRLSRRACAMCAMLVVVAAAGCPSGSEISLIYDQGNYGDSALQSVLEGADYAPGQQAANAFELATGLNTISRVRWWGTQARDVTEPNEFIIRVFQDNGAGWPREYPLYAIPVGTASRRNTGDTYGALSQPIYEYTSDLIPFSLEARTTYYLSIVNASGRSWSWLKTDDVSAPEVGFYRTGNSGPWAERIPVMLAFRLYE